MRLNMYLLATFIWLHKTNTVNWEIFVVEIFSYSMLCTKRGRLYENENLLREIFNTKYLQFTVVNFIIAGLS